MTGSRPSPPAERSLTSPIWILGHLVALAAIVGFVMLGAWQLRRHDERRALDQRITDRVASAAQPVGQLIAEYGETGDALDLRPAIATGTYLLDEEVILQARTRDGRSGNEVLTPLDLGDGTGLIVDRGWVPLDVSGPPVVGAEPPPAEVTVTGYLRPTQVRGRFGPADPATGDLDRISRVDLDRLQRQVDLDLLGVHLVLAEQHPPQVGELPLPLPAPQAGGGPPHLAYAFQWFAFAGVVLVGYPILLRRTAGKGRPPDPGVEASRLAG
jgi:cytochrome oxidase assembly protein ShyY1